LSADPVFENCREILLIVMENVSYTVSWRSGEIIVWLQEKLLPSQKDLFGTELLNLISANESSRKR
jgi:hypothetical protein